VTVPAISTMDNEAKEGWSGNDKMDVDELEGTPAVGKHKAVEVANEPAPKQPKAQGEKILVVDKVVEKAGYWVSTNLVSEPVPAWYTKGWDFLAVSDKGRLSLGVIQSQAQVLVCQIELLNVELWLLTNMEEAMFNMWLEAGGEMEEGEFADDVLESAG
jgi:hypothetical protein